MSEDQSSNDSEVTVADDSSTSEAEAAAPRKRSLAMPVAGLALLVALAAIAGVAWSWFEGVEVDEDDRASAERVETLHQALGEQDQRLDSLRSSVTELQEALDSHGAELADLRQSVRSQAEDREDMARRLSDLDAELAEAVARLEETAGDQRAVDRELARRLYLMEAAALLRSGQERAELVGDYSAARAAYRRAYRLLREFDDPRGNRARSLVAQELEALEGMSEPDWTSMTARIDRLVANVDEWPAIAVTTGTAEEVAAGDEPETGWWTRMGSTLAGLVRVQPRDTVPVTADELDAVREQVRLRLAAAELAIARRSLEETSRQLQRISEMIERWFDTDDSAVARGLSLLSELADTEPAELPNLGGALAEIQRLLEDS